MTLYDFGQFLNNFPTTSVFGVDQVDRCVRALRTQAEEREGRFGTLVNFHYYFNLLVVVEDKYVCSGCSATIGSVFVDWDTCRWLVYRHMMEVITSASRNFTSLRTGVDVIVGNNVPFFSDSFLLEMVFHVYFAR
jgi:hypothetical protein